MLTQSEFASINQLMFLMVLTGGCMAEKLIKGDQQAAIDTGTIDTRLFIIVHRPDIDGSEDYE